MHRTFEVSGPVALDVRLAAGDVQVDPTLDGRVEVELVAHDAESQRLVDAARIDLRESGDRPQVVVDVPQRGGGGFGLSIIFGRTGIDCRIRCPEGSTLGARTKSADVRALGRLGGADIATASGDVELRDVDGDATVKTASGDVQIADVAGAVNAATASGDVELAHVRGPLSVATASGDVRVRAADGDVHVATASGDGTIGSVAGGEVSANSASGDLEIGVRPGSRVYLDCSTVSGDARSELEATEGAEGEGPLVEIRARTMSGDIRIRRAQEVHA